MSRFRANEISLLKSSLVCPVQDIRLQDVSHHCLTSTTFAGPVASPEMVTEIPALISHPDQD